MYRTGQYATQARLSALLTGERMQPAAYEPPAHVHEWVSAAPTWPGYLLCAVCQQFQPSEVRP